MATRSWRGFAGQIGALIAVCTLVLVASFVGILALVSGQQTGTADRVPWYVVAGAVGFVLTIVVLELEVVEGRTVLATALGAGVGSTVVVLLVVEGVLFALRFPDEVFGTQLLVYLLAAALVATGLGYWLLEHWQEFRPAE